MADDIQNPGSALGESIGAESELKEAFITSDSLTLFDPPPYADESNE